MKMLLGNVLRDIVAPYEAMEQWQKGLFVVLSSAIVFICMEYGMIYSPVADYLRQLLKRNPKLSKEDIEHSVPLLVTRIVGFIHNAVQVMLAIAAGFFLHDAIACALRESPFYIIHGASCCAGYTAGACAGSMHFYGALFLLWEISTPFVQLRWALYKMGRTETLLYKANALLMVLSFFLARIVFGTFFVFLLSHDVFFELRNPRKTSKVSPGLWITFVAIAFTICSLNYFWFSKMVRVLINIAKGSSWTSVSEATVEERKKKAL